MPAPPRWAPRAIPDNVRNGYLLSMNPPAEAVKMYVTRPGGPGLTLRCQPFSQSSNLLTGPGTGSPIARERSTVVHYRIQGPARLGGRFRPSGNKNGALPILAACILADEPVVLENVPEIRDVFTMIDLMRQLGTEIEHVSDNTFRVDSSGLHTGSVDPELSRRIRASILLAGPLLARLGEVVLPPPGGDVIGRRRLDTHFLALGRLGSTIEAGESYELRAKELRGADIFLDEPSVTGTENAVLAAVRAEGETTIRNAAAEPHVQDLCNFLVSIGAEIEGVGTQRLNIRGVSHLDGGVWRIGTDHIEVGSMVGLAAITGSDLVIDAVEAEHFDPLRVGFEKLGIHCTLRDGELHVPSDQALEIQPDLGNQIPVLGDGPWPAFPADLMSIALVAATQCRGTILIHENGGGRIVESAWLGHGEPGHQGRDGPADRGARSRRRESDLQHRADRTRI